MRPEEGLVDIGEEFGQEMLEVGTDDLEFHVCLGCWAAYLEH